MSLWEAKKLKGNEEFKKKNYAAAVGLYTEGIQLDPSQDVLYSNRGLSYLNLNEPEKAKMDFSKAIESQQYKSNEANIIYVNTGRFIT